MSGIDIILVVAGVIIFSLVSWLCFSCRMPRKQEEKFQQKFEKWVGRCGYFNPKTHCFVDENKQGMTEAPRMIFRMRMHENSHHPLLIPCKIKEFIFFGNDCQICELEPLVEKSYIFTVKFTGFDMVLDNPDLGELLIPAKRMWHYQLGDQVQMHCVIGPSFKNGRETSAPLIYFEVEEK